MIVYLFLSSHFFSIFLIHPSFYLSFSPSYFSLCIYVFQTGAVFIIFPKLETRFNTHYQNV